MEEQHLKTGEDKLMTAAADKRARRKETTHRSYVMSATKTAIPTLVFSAISDAATIQQEINNNKNIDVSSLVISLTDGGLCETLHIHIVAFSFL